MATRKRKAELISDPNEKNKADRAPKKAKLRYGGSNFKDDLLTY